MPEDEHGDGLAGGGIDQHLHAVAAAGAACLDRSLSAHRQELGRVHQVDLDVSTWTRRLTGPERQQLEAARRELAIAEYAAAIGLYRQAYASLRLFLELSFAAVYFSVNELDRRKWLSDRKDFSWSKALDEDEGVLATAFVREFEPDVVEEAKAYAQASAGVYRACSQFVHGKARTAASLPQRVDFDGQVLSDWCTLAARAGESVLFLLYIRYGRDLRAEFDQDLQDIQISHFGHLIAVRRQLGLAGD